MKHNNVDVCVANVNALQRKILIWNEKGYNLVSTCTVENRVYLFFEKEYN